MAYIRGENKPVDGSEGECPFCRVPASATRRGWSCTAASWLRRAQPLPLLAGAPDGLPLPARRRLHRDHRRGGRRDRRPHPAGDARDPLRVRGRRLQHRHEPGPHRRRRHRRAPAPARRPALVGDQNFMPIIGRTKTLPELLADTRGPAGRGLARSAEDRLDRARSLRGRGEREECDQERRCRTGTPRTTEGPCSLAPPRSPATPPLSTRPSIYVRDEVHADCHADGGLPGPVTGGRPQQRPMHRDELMGDPGGGARFRRRAGSAARKRGELLGGALWWRSGRSR